MLQEQLIRRRATLPSLVAQHLEQMEPGKDFTDDTAFAAKVDAGMALIAKTLKVSNYEAARLLACEARHRRSATKPAPRVRTARVPIQRGRSEARPGHKRGERATSSSSDDPDLDDPEPSVEEDADPRVCPHPKCDEPKTQRGRTCGSDRCARWEYRHRDELRSEYAVLQKPDRAKGCGCGGLPWLDDDELRCLACGKLATVNGEPVEPLGPFLSWLRAAPARRSNGTPARLPRLGPDDHRRVKRLIYEHGMRPLKARRFTEARRRDYGDQVPQPLRAKAVLRAQGRPHRPPRLSSKPTAEVPGQVAEGRLLTPRRLDGSGLNATSDTHRSGLGSTSRGGPMSASNRAAHRTDWKSDHPALRTKESEPDTLLTAADLAERWQVPKAHVYRLARTGQLPVVNLGPRYRRFSLTAIREFESVGGTAASE